MEPKTDIRIVVNPASAAGKTYRRLPEIVRALERGLDRRCSFALTRSPGDALRLGAEAVASGTPVLIAVGGDGTIHEVVNGMMGASGGGPPGTALGIVSSGSGQGFALSLGLPRDIGEQIAIIAGGRTRSVDLGLVTTAPFRRYFINECQIGIGADVVRKTSRRQKTAGGLLAYGAATVSAIFSSRNVPLTLHLDGEHFPRSMVLGLSVGNGRLTGGGMSLTPLARLDDGLLDLLLIRGQSLASRLRSFPRIYTGGYLHDRRFSSRTFRHMEVCSSEPVAVAADGEIIGQVPCTVAIVPSALRLICPYACREN